MVVGSGRNKESESAVKAGRERVRTTSTSLQAMFPKAQQAFSFTSACLGWARMAAILAVIPPAAATSTWLASLFAARTWLGLGLACEAGGG